MEKINIDKLNHPLIEQIIEKILAEPRAFNMEIVLQEAGEAGQYGELAPACNTVGCIAGWAVLLTHGIQQAHTYTHPGLKPRQDIIEEAAGLLGMSKQEAKQVFFVENWPDPFWHDYREVGHYHYDDSMAEKLARIVGEAKVSVARLRHLMEKGE